MPYNWIIFFFSQSLLSFITGMLTLSLIDFVFKCSLFLGKHIDFKLINKETTPTMALFFYCRILKNLIQYTQVHQTVTKLFLLTAKPPSVATLGGFLSLKFGFKLKRWFIALHIKLYIRLYQHVKPLSSNSHFENLFFYINLW